jgi:hypothetical protein
MLDALKNCLALLRCKKRASKEVNASARHRRFAKGFHDRHDLLAELGRLSSYLDMLRYDPREAALRARAVARERYRGEPASIFGGLGHNQANEVLHCRSLHIELDSCHAGLHARKEVGLVVGV